MDDATTPTDSSSSHVVLTKYGSAAGGLVTSTARFGTKSFNTANATRYGTTAWYSGLYLDGDFTIECWINPSTVATATDGAFIATLGEGYGLGYPQWTLKRVDSTLKFVMAASSSSPSFVISLSFGTIVAGQWQHVAVTRQGNTFRAFIDGTLVATGTGSGKPYVDTARRLSIGGDTAGYSTRFFNGYIDEMRITKNACLYASDFDVPTAAFEA